LNAKAQAWWWVRMKVEATSQAVVLRHRPFDPEALLSLPSNLPELGELPLELSQPTLPTRNCIWSDGVSFLRLQGTRAREGDGES